MQYNKVDTHYSVELQGNAQLILCKRSSRALSRSHALPDVLSSHMPPRQKADMRRPCIGRRADYRTRRWWHLRGIRANGGPWRSALPHACGG